MGRVFGLCNTVRFLVCKIERFGIASRLHDCTGCPVLTDRGPVWLGVQLTGYGKIADISGRIVDTGVKSLTFPVELLILV